MRVEASPNEAVAPASDLSGRGWLVVVAIIAAAAFAVIIPMFWLGIPSGHDFEFHVNSWMEVASQWRQGIVYLRWAAMANYGYGEPRFIFYPPASWMLGAGLGMVLPWVIVPGVYIWAVLTAAGCSMFVLARNWLPQKDAVFAAVFYAVNPYHLVIVYWRSAFAELLASVWLPLLLLFVLRLGAGPRSDRKTIAYLSSVVAAVWLTNLPAAVMVNYSLVLLVGVAALVRRSPRVLLYGAVAVALGLALAAFYVLPAGYEERWVHINETLDPIVRPQSNFLFTMMADPDHNRFNLLVSVIATLEILALLVAGLIYWRRRKERPEIWWTVSAWGGAAALLMLPITAILWRFLPQLRFVQLPWRWLLCLNVAIALLVTMGMRRWLSRALVYAAMLAALAAGWHWIQPPWWDTRVDIAAMIGNMEGGGYESVREYIPTAGDIENIQRNAPPVAVEGESGRIQIESWTPTAKLFNAGVVQPERVVLHLFNYPAWKVEVNGRPAATETQEDTGQLMIPIQPGENHIRVVFSRTWDRTVGALISGLALLILALLLFVERYRAGDPARDGGLQAVDQRGLR